MTCGNSYSGVISTFPQFGADANLKTSSVMGVLLL